MAQQGNSLVADLVNEMQQPNMGGMQYPPQQQMMGGMYPQQPMEMPQQQQMMQQGGVAPIMQDPSIQGGYPVAMGEDMVDEYDEEEMMEQQPRGAMPPMDMTQFGMAEEGEKSWIDSIMEGLRDPVIVAALFVILSLPQVNRTLIQLLPAIGNNLYYTLGFKAVVLAVVYFLIRFFLG